MGLTDLRKAFAVMGADFPRGRPFWQHESFTKVAKGNKLLQDITVYLPSSLEEKIFDDQQTIEQAWSSYKDHGYGFFFYALTRVLKPRICVELGVLQGFSLLTVARGLRDNKQGTIKGFDLFEDYPYHHEHFMNVRERIKMTSLENIAAVERSDAFEVYKKFDSVDYLHVDISNNGDTLRKIFEQWSHKVQGVMIFEGGSQQRDQVEWMIKYQKPPLVKALEELRRQYLDWQIFVFEPFPSLTMAIRK